ncbi:MAG: hypothetical protein ACTXOO_01810 [Sodalis sp. (in: enterobacteria)]
MPIKDALNAVKTAHNSLQLNASANPILPLIIAAICELEQETALVKQAEIL